MFLEILYITINVLTLTIVEIILSMDNIIFIVLVTEDLNSKVKLIAQKLGVVIAIIGRVLLLIILYKLSSLNKDLFFILNIGISIKDIVLILGGIYLIYFGIFKIITEIRQNNNLEVKIDKKTSFIKAFVLICLFDSLFSFDSVLTALNIGHNLYVMGIAILIGSLILFLNINYISTFISNHSNIKIFALILLIVIGCSLLCNAFDYIIKGYQICVIMFLVGFTQLITTLNLKKNK